MYWLNLIDVANVVGVSSDRRHENNHKVNLKVNMASAGSEGSPTVPSTPTPNENSSERSFSRSPSISSVRDFQWTSLLVSNKPAKNKSKFLKGKFVVRICFAIFGVAWAG